MKRIATLVASIALGMPGVALAQSSSACQAYNPQICNVSPGPSKGDPADPKASTASSTLPFTGLDVVLLVLGASALLGGGLVVRGLSRRLDPGRRHTVS